MHFIISLALCALLLGCSVEGEGIYFVNADDIAEAPNPLAWGQPAQVLRMDMATGGALRVTVPAGWDAQVPLRYSASLEVIVLKGGLALGPHALAKWDYVRVPAGEEVSGRSESGAQFLMFFEGTYPFIVSPDPDHAPVPMTIVKRGAAPWMAGTAMADAGRDDVPLKIKHYKNDPQTGARTYLVAVQPGVTIPWETHAVPEEAYVLEGDYTLAECLPDGEQVGTYHVGGYFYRPPGIAHNGPKSGTQTGTVMLVRTPAALKVDLVDGCA